MLLLASILDLGQILILQSKSWVSFSWGEIKCTKSSSCQSEARRPILYICEEGKRHENQDRFIGDAVALQ